MRKATSVIVGVASASAIGASWAAGLTPKEPVSAVTLAAAPPPVTRSTGDASRGASGGRTPTAPPAPSSKHAGPASGAGPRKATASGGSGGSGGSGTPAAPHPRTVDGGVASTQYGDVQVSITVVGSRITDVTALHLTDSSGHSVRISNRAAPVLRREALAAQSAQIDMVSGATYTSEAYQQSLQSAIDAAHL